MEPSNYFLNQLSSSQEISFTILILDYYSQWICVFDDKKQRSLVTNHSWFQSVACLNGGKGHGQDREKQINNVKVLLPHIFITSNQRWCVYVSLLPKGTTGCSVKQSHLRVYDHSQERRALWALPSSFHTSISIQYRFLKTVADMAMHPNQWLQC